MNYIINIGEVFDVCLNTMKPKQTLIITNEQFEIIKQFANTEKDADLNTLYVINNSKFSVVPEFKIRFPNDIAEITRYVDRNGCEFSRVSSGLFDNNLHKALSSNNCKELTYCNKIFRVGDKIAINVLIETGSVYYIKSFGINTIGEVVVNYESDTNKFGYGYGTCQIENLIKL